MIRCAVPKGRLSRVVTEAFSAAGVRWKPEPAAAAGRRLRQRSEDGSFELLWLKDRDLPLYVERGIADCGILGRDLLEDRDGDLLVPAEFRHGVCRLCLVGPVDSTVPGAGAQVRIATKYPRIAQRWLATQPFAAEILELSGSVELAPVLGLAEMAIDIVETGATLRAHDLVELQTILEVRPCLVVHRGAWQGLREEILRWIGRFERAGVLQ